MISCSAIQQVVDKMRNKQHRTSTQANYYGIWKCFNEFVIRLDSKPASWEDRLVLFIGYLIQTDKKSNTIRSYVLAIKTVLFRGGIELNEDRTLLRALTRGCKLTKDKVYVRLPICKDLLIILLKNIKEMCDDQPFLVTLYQAFFAATYYGLFKIGELSFGPHVIRVNDVHIGQNKRKLMFLLRTSKTHDESSHPQIIKISSTDKTCEFKG